VKISTGRSPRETRNHLKLMCACHSVLALE
jgi:hypothetical protein